MWGNSGWAFPFGMARMVPTILAKHRKETPRSYGQMPFPGIIVGSDIVQLPDDINHSLRIGKSLLIIRPLIMCVGMYYVSDS
jgi:hypothetical protein